MIKMDAEFNRIVLCDVKNDISRAFNSLDYETRRGVLSERCQHPEIIKKKAHQMKEEINGFIDAQVNQIIAEMVGE